MSLSIREATMQLVSNYRARLFWPVTAAFLLALILAGSNVFAQNALRAGAATANITPPLGSSINGGMQDRTADSIQDELHARALVLDNGETQLALVVVDSCLIPREIFDEAKFIAHQRTGIPIENMLMSATHTHSAPTATAAFQSEPDKRYTDFLTVRIADAVSRAHGNLEPAQIGWGMGKVPQHVFNRRWFMKEGTIAPNPFGAIDKVKTNPPAGGPERVKPAGPTDPTLVVVAVRRPDGTPFSLYANYSLHYVGGTGGGVSADYYGAFAQRMKDLLTDGNSNKSFVGMLSNGTSGNINNVDFFHKRQQKKPFEQINLVAGDVAAEALRVYSSLEFHDWIPLRTEQTQIDLGVRRPDEEEVLQAKKIVMSAKGPTMQTLEEIYARETIFLSDYPERVPLILQAFRIQDLA